MNLVFGTSNVREKTDLGAWGRTQAQPGDWGRLSGCFSKIKEIREKTDFRGRGCIGLSTREGTRSWSTHLVLAHCTDNYCFVGVLSKLVRLRFYVDL